MSVSAKKRTLVSRATAPVGSIVAVLYSEDAGVQRFLNRISQRESEARMGDTVAIAAHNDGLFQDLCVFENLYLGVGPHSRLGFRSQGLKRRVDELLAACGSGLTWSSPCDRLQAAEVVLLSALRCLLQERQVYIIEGLLARLSPKASAGISRLMAARAEDGATIWYTLSDMRFSVESTTHVCCVRDGTEVYFGARGSASAPLLQSFTSRSEVEAEAVLRDEALRAVGNEPSVEALFRSIYRLGEECLGWIGAHFVGQGSVSGSFGSVRPDAELVEKLESAIFRGEQTLAADLGARGWTAHLPDPAHGAIRFGLLVFVPQSTLCAVSTEVFLRAMRAALEETWRTMEADRKSKRDLTLQAISTLAGGVVHEFNNSLFVVNTSVETLAALNQDDALLAPLEAIRQTTQHSAQLTEKMLSLTHAGAEPHRPMELNSLVEEARVFLEASAMKYGIGLCFENNAESAWISAGRAEVHGMVVNLVRNGIEASRSGETSTLTITVSNAWADGDTRMHRFVCPGLRRPDEFVRLSVRDDGKGMTQAELERAFEPLETTNATSGGSGLGLAIVYRSMLDHNGYVEMDSAVGLGTEVHLYFPRCEPEVAPVASGHDISAKDGLPGAPDRERTILVCDDEQRVRSSVERILRLSGYAVEVTEDGESCVSSFRANPSRYDALLIDDLMPGISGHECLERIRSIDQTVPVFVVSGYFKPERFADHVHSEWTRFHPKPVEWSSLLEEVGLLVQKRDVTLSTGA